MEDSANKKAPLSGSGGRRAKDIGLRENSNLYSANFQDVATADANLLLERVIVDQQATIYSLRLQLAALEIENDYLKAVLYVTKN